jgi:hypothetical protein
VKARKFGPFYEISAVGLRPVPDGKDLDGIAVIVEANPVSAYPQTKLRRFGVLKAFDVALPGLYESGQPVEDPHCRCPIHSADVGLGLSGPINPLGHYLLVRAVLFRRKRRAAHFLKVIQGEAELGQHFLMRNRLVVLQPLASRGSCAIFVYADLFILDWHVSGCSGHRIEHGLQQNTHGTELLRRQAVEISVSLLAFLDKVESHTVTSLYSPI